ncbi:hypothetical protein LEP1GSC060_3524 [Leptospira weilii serovar Ranarum str. ICFT]|uniref:Integrase core domain protein n=1 Tax=Leptospira weilii serovar Ranarum str. ICFT TaxID=1218598 RepID=N1WL72_9LEPT|nr:hypothetical protein LEP1GSC060_3524 [Leptospira weilii serovar Ranarum str. ICFT]
MRTTNSNHPFFKHPNLIKNLIPAEPHLILVSDITYIRVGDGFAFLSLVTDLFSRKIVGFKLHHSLETAGCIHALNMALDQVPERQKDHPSFGSRHSILFEGLHGHFT